MAKERNINDTISEITELVKLQQSALKISDGLIALKDLKIEMLEDMVDLNRKQLKSSYVLSGILAIAWLVTLAMFISNL
jgi:hypothetical protein